MLGRKPEAINVRPGAPGGGAACRSGPAAARRRGGGRGGRGGAGGGRGGGRRRPRRARIGHCPARRFSRPTDVAWDRAGNIYVADGIGTNNRIAKFDKDGQFITHWGSTGSGPGPVQRREGARRSTRRATSTSPTPATSASRCSTATARSSREFGNVGTPLTMCMTRGATQYLYISHAGDEDGMEDAAIYKVQLDGKVVGKFGSAGKLPKEFGLANSIDCRNENELLVGEMTNWRVQKVTLKAAR